jgi:hypothetical protein
LGCDLALGEALRLHLGVEGREAFGVERRADVVEHGRDLGGGLVGVDQREDGLGGDDVLVVLQSGEVVLGDRRVGGEQVAAVDGVGVERVDDRGADLERDELGELGAVELLEARDAERRSLRELGRATELDVARRLGR